jgi:sRNA-binding carbon storage regulator CsrA
MKAPHNPERRGLSLSMRLGEYVEITVAGESVLIYLYETHKTSARLTIRADKAVNIKRPDRVKEDPCSS